MAANYPDLTQEELDALNDTMGQNAPNALADQVSSQQGSAYSQLFGPNAEMQSRLAPQLADKNAAQSAEVFGPEAPSTIPANQQLVPRGDSSITTTGEAPSEAAEAAGDIGERGLVPVGEKGLATVGEKGLATIGQNSSKLVPGLGDALLLYEAAKSKETAPAELDEAKANVDRLVGLQKKLFAARKAAAYGPPAPKDSEDEEGDDKSVLNENDTSPSDAKTVGDLMGNQNNPPASVGGGLASAVSPASSPQDALQQKLLAYQQAIAPQAQAPQSNSLQSLLSQVYGPNASDSALQKAQAQQADMAQNSRFAAIAQGLGHALSKGNYKPDYAYSDLLAKQAGQAPANIQQLREGQLGAATGALKLSDLNDKTQQDDPNSPLSQATQKIASQYNPGKDFSGSSYTAITKMQPMIDTAVHMEYYTALKQQAMQAQQDRQDQKREDDSRKAMGAMNKDIVTGLNRGAPSVAAQSVLAGQKVLDLFKPTPDNPTGDPEKWNADQVALFRTETQKLAKGASPTEGETSGFIRPDAATYLARAGTFITGDTVRSGQGNQIRSIVPYIHNAMDTSNQFIRQRVYDPTVASYRGRVNPEDVDYWKTQNPQMYPELQNPLTKAQGVQAAPMAPPRAAPPPHKDDTAAVSWAKDNLKDPRAKEILRLNNIPESP